MQEVNGSIPFRSTSFKAESLRQERALGDDVTPERKLKARRRPQPTKTKKFGYANQVEGYALKAREWHVRDEYAVRLTFGFARRSMYGE